MPDRISYKSIGLVGTVLGILAIFTGGVMWISTHIASNTVSIQAHDKAIIRIENIVEKNTELIHQHARLLVILETHGAQLKILTNFMIRGKRYTLEMGLKHERRTQTLEEWVKHAPPDWLESQVDRIEDGLMDITKVVRENHEQIALLNQQLREGK